MRTEELPHKWMIVHLAKVAPELSCVWQEKQSYATQVEKFKSRHTYDRAIQVNASLFYANN